MGHSEPPDRFSRFRGLPTREPFRARIDNQSAPIRHSREQAEGLRRFASLYRIRSSKTLLPDRRNNADCRRGMFIARAIDLILQCFRQSVLFA
jgi:hypothetical protein